MKKIDISEPRRMYWNDEADPLHGCPECKKELVKELQTYMVVIARIKKILPYMMSTDCGYFCPDCPVVILDRDEFTYLTRAATNIDEPVFAVSGIVDSNAIPEDKKHLPYGHKDNPIPLVEFLPRKDKKLETIKPLVQPVEPVKQRKIGRNESCPCGSGKKYKKCCL